MGGISCAFFELLQAVGQSPILATIVGGLLVGAIVGLIGNEEGRGLGCLLLIIVVVFIGIALFHPAYCS